jgi:hypothetical protein
MENRLFVKQKKIIYSTHLDEYGKNQHFFDKFSFLKYVANKN